MDIYEIRRQRLRQLINDDPRFKGVDAAFAAAIDRQASYVSRLFTKNLNHRRNIGEDLARTIEEILGLEKNSLDKPFTSDAPIAAEEARGTYHIPNSSSQFPSKNTENLNESRRLIPLLSWSQAVQWTRGMEKQKIDVTTYREVSGSIGQDAFALIQEDDSMLNPNGVPTIPPGAVLRVEPSVPAANLSIVIALVPGSPTPTCKQLVEDAGRRYLKPLNPRYPIIDLDNGKADILGVVRKIEIDL